MRELIFLSLMLSSGCTANIYLSPHEGRDTEVQPSLEKELLDDAFDDKKQDILRGSSPNRKGPIRYFRRETGRRRYTHTY